MRVSIGGHWLAMTRTLQTLFGRQIPGSPQDDWIEILEAVRADTKPLLGHFKTMRPLWDFVSLSGSWANPTDPATKHSFVDDRPRVDGGETFPNWRFNRADYDQAVTEDPNLKEELEEIYDGTWRVRGLYAQHPDVIYETDTVVTTSFDEEVGAKVGQIVVWGLARCGWVSARIDFHEFLGGQHKGYHRCFHADIRLVTLPNLLDTVVGGDAVLRGLLEHIQAWRNARQSKLDEAFELERDVNNCRQFMAIRQPIATP